MSVIEKLRFLDGLVWTTGLTVEINLFSNSSGVVRTRPKAPIQMCFDALDT